MKSISFLNLEVIPTGIVERDGRERRQRLAFVPNQGIERIELASGFVAERQWLQLAVAGLLATVGLAVALRVSIRIGAFPAAFGMIMLVVALRRGRYLRVVTSSGVRKLPIHGHFHEHELDAFLNDAKQMLGSP